ncbi:MAG: type I secretion system permease/ATPase [Alphaproteobacteria bacterium]|nr:type I secretion system permease/ATPase [Alphaproteobacteria bacterium]
MAKAKNAVSEASAVIKSIRGSLAYVFVFSFFISLAMLAVPVYMLQIFDRVLSTRSVDTLIVITIVTVGILVVLGILEAVRSRVLVSIAGRIDYLLAGRVFESIFKAQKTAPEIYPSQAIQDVYFLRNFISGRSVTAILDLPWSPFFLLIIFMIHPVIGLFVLIGSLIIAAIGIFSDRLVRGPTEMGLKQQRNASRLVERSLVNLDALGSMGMLGHLRHRWLRQHDDAVELQDDGAIRQGMAGAATTTLRFLMQIGVLGIGAYYAVMQEISPGAMIAANILLSRAIGPLEMGIASWPQVLVAKDSYRRIRYLLDNFTEDREAVRLPEVKGAIDFSKVVYGPKGGPSIIRRVSFKLEPGEQLGVVGPSGAGKSTLLKLLIGGLAPASGVIRIDGADIKTWDQDQIGSAIGYLPQDVELFVGSVAENIARLGEADDAKIIEAAGRAKAHDLITALPNGYQTDVGEFGHLLSGGQRQRIGLARALYDNPQIVVLDEPNAHLDGEGTSALLSALNDLKKEGVTVIIATHTPQMLRTMDKLMFIRGGYVERFGPAGEVMPGLLGAVKRPQITADNGDAKLPEEGDDNRLTNEGGGQ